MTIAISTIGSPYQNKTLATKTNMWTGVTLNYGDLLVVCTAGDTKPTSVQLLLPEVYLYNYTSGFESSSVPYKAGGNGSVQTIKPSFLATLSTIKAYLRYASAPITGTLVINLWGESVICPTRDNAPIATATPTVDLSTLTNSYVEYTFTFSPSVILSPNINYNIEFFSSDLTGAVGMRSNGANPYGNGVFLQGDGIGNVMSPISNFDLDLITNVTAQTEETLSEAVTATNTGNVITTIWYYMNTKQPATNATIAITPSATGAHAATAYKISGLLITNTLDRNTSATGTGTSGSSGATESLSQTIECIVGAVGSEDSGDAGDLVGVWTTGGGNVSGNEQKVGTTGGGDASNVNIYSAVESVSINTAQTAGVTGMDSIDWAAVVATFRGKEISLLPQSPQQRNYIRM